MRSAPGAKQCAPAEAPGAVLAARENTQRRPPPQLATDWESLDRRRPPRQAPPSASARAPAGTYDRAARRWAQAAARSSVSCHAQDQGTGIYAATIGPGESFGARYYRGSTYWPGSNFNAPLALQDPAGSGAPTDPRLHRHQPLEPRCYEHYSCLKLAIEQHTSRPGCVRRGAARGEWSQTGGARAGAGAGAAAPAGSEDKGGCSRHARQDILQKQSGPR